MPTGKPTEYMLRYARMIKSYYDQKAPGFWAIPEYAIKAGLVEYLREQGIVIILGDYVASSIDPSYQVSLDFEASAALHGNTPADMVYLGKQLNPPVASSHYWKLEDHVARPPARGAATPAATALPASQVPAPQKNPLKTGKKK